MNQIISKILLTRPRIEIPFSAENNLWTAYLNSTYVSTGKILSRQVVISEDKLTRTITMVWASEEARQEYLNDPITIQALKEEKNHRSQNGIGFSWEHSEIDGNTVIRTWSGGETD